MDEMMLYKVLDIDHDGNVLREKSAQKVSDADRIAAWDLMDERICAVGIYRYNRAAGSYTHCKTVFRRATLANWRED